MLLLVLAGWLRERRRQAHGRRSSFYETWVVDPWGVVRGRGLWFVPLVVAAGTFALFGAGAGTVGLVEVSESNTFCTEACHAVMGPEGTAYTYTAHSRIACVECHVGAGPEGFLSAKLGGMRQLYAVASGTREPPDPDADPRGEHARRAARAVTFPSGTSATWVGRTRTSTRARTSRATAW